LPEWEGNCLYHMVQETGITWIVKHNQIPDDELGILSLLHIRCILSHACHFLAVRLMWNKSPISLITHQSSGEMIERVFVTSEEETWLRDMADFSTAAAAGIGLEQQVRDNLTRASQ
jgi:hypothetical protein